MSETLAVSACNPLGAFVQCTLAWSSLPPPQPGQVLRMQDGRIMIPMLPLQDGLLTVLSEHAPLGEYLTLQSIEGTPVAWAADEDVILMAEGLALAALIHLCALRRNVAGRTLAVYALPAPAPFKPRPSRFLLPGMPAGVMAAIPLLEDWGIPSRLCSLEERPGCFQGDLDAFLPYLTQVGFRMIRL